MRWYLCLVIACVLLKDLLFVSILVLEVFLVTVENSGLVQVVYLFRPILSGGASGELYNSISYTAKEKDLHVIYFHLQVKEQTTGRHGVVRDSVFVVKRKQQV